MDHPQETVETPGLKWKDVSTLLPKWERGSKFSYPPLITTSLLLSRQSVLTSSAENQRNNSCKLLITLESVIRF